MVLTLPKVDVENAERWWGTVGFEVVLAMLKGGGCKIPDPFKRVGAKTCTLGAFHLVHTHLYMQFEPPPPFLHVIRNGNV